MSGYIAHVRKESDGLLIEHWLVDHLAKVGLKAGTFAASFGATPWATLAGLWHDLGKYNPKFQHYIGLKTGYKAHLEDESDPSKVDHATAGAIHATRLLDDPLGRFYRGRLLSYAIAGHHGGLPNWMGECGSNLADRLNPDSSPHKQFLYQECLTQPIPSFILNAPMPEQINPLLPLKESGELAHSLWIRMLFSCLIDADRLDTEGFMNPEQAQARQKPQPTLADLKQRLDQFLINKTAQAPKSKVNDIRAEVLTQCRTMAHEPPGFFQLAVPTGGGKTLSGTAFALDHAVTHGKRRIIYAIPYTSIIEQTAEVLRTALGDDDKTLVLEHHSNVETPSEKDTEQTHLATENWDAPVIVTTNVQLFESLFAARTSRARKLHNIAGSVLVLDEVQQIPWEFKQPIEACLQALAAGFGCTVVFSSATQPPWNLPNVRPVMLDAQGLHDRLRRVEVQQPGDATPRQWPELADELAGHRQVLCIVNTRANCRELYQELKARQPEGHCDEGTIHLSALMCGAHRSAVIQAIKERLKANLPVRVVSTQLVEAGVDLDFPVVYRAMAGLDSVAQAAGRCNREGKLPGLGQVILFEPPPNEKLPGILKKALQEMRSVIDYVKQGKLPADLLDPQVLACYFTRLQPEINSLDKNGVMRMLRNNTDLVFQFKDAEAAFKLIDNDTGYQPVVVRYKDNLDRIESVLDELKHIGPSRGRLRALQRYIVTVPQYHHQALLKARAIEECAKVPGLFVQVKGVDLYDEFIGLKVDVKSAVLYQPEALMP